ncbi:oxidoreductase [Glonium stellatum]|uniref:Oxidoreductase n=1 Tax=Glonium stellatum TaxID=574774 RepID=A0A8E2JN98_9PEZI|nr:oxidoreductase [Glonium stellatum]
MPTNTAVWLTSPTSKSLEVKSAPYTSPGRNELVIKNGAVAINPADWLKQDLGNMMFGWIKYPFINGTDVAGEVVEVGPGVTHFKIGDRVVSHAASICKDYNNSAYGAFQTYTILLAHMTSHIPSTMSYEEGAVLPLGVSTAACGLFQKDQLALQLPSVSPRPTNTGKTLLVWGGSTTVGSNAIQLAVAAGYEVITTASPRNFDYVKKLGASQAFDYNSRTVVADIIHAFKGKTIAGAYSVGQGASEACMDVLNKCEGNKLIAMASYPLPQPPPKHLVLLKTIFYFMSWGISMWFKSKTRGIGMKFIFGDTLIGNGVGKAVYEDFLSKALADGTYIAAPDPLVVGKGLESVQAGFDIQRKGVSAKKVVISL